MIKEISQLYFELYPKHFEINIDVLMISQAIDIWDRIYNTPDHPNRKLFKIYCGKTEPSILVSQMLYILFDITIVTNTKIVNRFTENCKRLGKQPKGKLAYLVDQLENRDMAVFLNSKVDIMHLFSKYKFILDLS